MTGRSLLAAAILVGFTAPALAFHCPKDVAAIDAAMAKGNWTEAQKAEVTKLRDEGEALHKAGDHQGAVNNLSEAMRAMLNSM